MVINSEVLRKNIDSTFSHVVSLGDLGPQTRFEKALKDIRAGIPPTLPDESYCQSIVIFTQKIDKSRKIVYEKMPSIMQNVFPTANDVFSHQFISGNLIADLAGIGRCGELCAVYIKCLMQYYKEHPAESIQQHQSLADAGSRIPFDIMWINLIVEKTGWNHSILFLAPYGKLKDDHILPKEQPLSSMIDVLKNIRGGFLVDPSCKCVCNLSVDNELNKFYQYLTAHQVVSNTSLQCTFSGAVCCPTNLLDNLKEARRITSPRDLTLNIASVFNEPGPWRDGLGPKSPIPYDPTIAKDAV